MARFDEAIYAQCWEDPELEIEALRIGPEDRVLIITSGGCNSLGLLTCEPRELISLDFNPGQNALLELKLAGIRALNHEEFLELVGARFLDDRPPEAAPRDVLYRRVRDLLSPTARAYWDERPVALAKGILQAGQFESYMRVFHFLLRIAIRKKHLLGLLRQPFETQYEYFRMHWDGPFWRLFFRILFSKRMLGKYGLDPSFFTHVGDIGSYGDHFRRRVDQGFATLPVADNYFVAMGCLGRFLNRQTVPRYLEARHFPTLKRTVDRVRVVTQDLMTFLAETEEPIDKFALSNVFEWVDQATFETMLKAVWQKAGPDALLCYRNLLALRVTPESLDGQIRTRRDESTRLGVRDRAIVNNNFLVAEILKGGSLPLGTEPRIASGVRS